MHKELRTKHLSNLENLVENTIADLFASNANMTPNQINILQQASVQLNELSTNDSNTISSNDSSDSINSNNPVIVFGVSQNDETPAIDRLEILRKISELQTELDHVKMEKELYFNQVEILENYFRKIDEAMAVEEHKAHFEVDEIESPEENSLENSTGLSKHREQEREINDLKVNF